MDFNTVYGFILVGAGIFSLRAAFLGWNIEASETPKLSKSASRVIYILTGIVLIVFGILRIK